MPARGHTGSVMSPGWQHVMLKQVVKSLTAAGGVTSVWTLGSCRSGEVLDVWADVDVDVVANVRLDQIIPYALSKISTPIWAREVSSSASHDTARFIFADGTRLDLLIASAEAPFVEVGGVPAARHLPGAPVGSRPHTRLEPSDLDQLRFAAALAVVKYARTDLLISSHLVLGIMRKCLGEALRDRTEGTSSHRSVVRTTRS